MKTVLLTGAGGFVGRTAIRPLLQSGYVVHAVTSKQIDETDPCLFYHDIDLLDSQRSDERVASIQPTHLLHFAWNVKHGTFWDSPENDDWVRGSLNLLRSFAAHGGKRVVMAGTCAEYDWQIEQEQFLEDDSPINPQTIYGKAKQELYLELKANAEPWRMSYAWGRIFFLFGAFEQEARFVPSVIRSLLRGEEAKCSSGDQIRDLMYVEDVGRAFVALLESDVSGAVNIGTGSSPRLSEVAKLIADIIGTPELLQLGALPSRPGEPSTLIADTKRLREEVKFDQFTDLRSALERTIEWWRDHK